MKRKNTKNIFVIIYYVSILAVILYGEISCIVKAFNCNWDPVGKAEVIYTAASLTGFGTIVGYIEIEDK